MLVPIHPALFFFVAALLAAVLPSRFRRAVQLAVPILAFIFLRNLIQVPQANLFFLGFTFRLVYIDQLSLLFSYTFLVFGFLANLYALHSEKKEIHIASNLYVGSSIGAILAGDLITLFIFWEIMALTSAVLIWNRQRSSSLGALFRYLLVHLTGGLFFFMGILLRLQENNSLMISGMGLDLAGWMFFIGFCVNAAVPPVHAWMADAYPEGTPSGSVYLSCFTSKVAVYVFARVFLGEDLLIYLGAIAAVYGVIYALMENDIRRLLSYHIICQVGYMLIGIGIGGHLGLNAGVGHAIGNILFKGLLFMATGAMIHMTGYSKLSDLGGLAKKSTWLVIFYMVGALAISGAPLLNGYVTKTLLVQAAGQAHYGWLELVMLAVAIGTFMSIALKLAYFAFWTRKTPPSLKQPIASNMYLAMGLTSALCILLGVYPKLLFDLLPYPHHYHVFDITHVLQTFELLIGTLVGFMLIRKYLHTKDVISLDTDWLYRKGASFFIKRICNPTRQLQENIQDRWTQSISNTYGNLMTFFRHQIITTVGWPLLIMSSASLVIGLIIIWTI